MTQSDFYSQFMPEFTACMPMIASWLSNQDIVVTEKWQQSLEPVDCKIACKILNDWMVRDNPIKATCDWQDIPRHLRNEHAKRTARSGDEWRKNVIETKPLDIHSDVMMEPYIARISKVCGEYQSRYNYWFDDAAKAECRECVNAIIAEFNTALDQQEHAKRKGYREVSV